MLQKSNMVKYVEFVSQLDCAMLSSSAPAWMNVLYAPC